jgi:hypothetical protein
LGVEHLVTAGFTMPHISSQVWYFVGGIIFVFIAVMPFMTYVKLWKRRRAIRGKILLFIRKPAGGIELELCPVFGRAVYRYVSKDGKVRKVADPNDPRVGKEVYFLKERNPDVLITKEDVTYKDDRGKERKGVKELTLSPSQAETRGIDLEQNPALHTGRPHILWPPLETESFWSATVSIPVAEVVEGQNEEVDSLSIAINTWKTDPTYIASMGGTLVDEKVTSMMAFWSRINKELMDKLAKFVNPMVVYIGLGMIAVMLVVCIYYITKQNTTIGQLRDLVNTIPGVGK